MRRLCSVIESQQATPKRIRAMTGHSGHMPLFALGDDRPPAAPAGFWKRWSPIREVKEGGAPTAS